LLVLQAFDLVIQKGDRGHRTQVAVFHGALGCTKFVQPFFQLCPFCRREFAFALFRRLAEKRELSLDYLRFERIFPA
jgi:hypothetical protein